MDMMQPLAEKDKVLLGGIKKEVDNMKRIILILILICLSSFVLAEDFPNTYCGNGVCEPPETKDICCEDCGGCMGVVETGIMDVVETGIMDVVETGIMDVVENDVVKTDDDEKYDDKVEVVEIREKKKSIFGIIIDFFKRLFGIDTEKNQPQKNVTSSEVEEIIEPDGEELQTEPGNIVKEDTDKFIDKNIDNDKDISDKDIINDFDKEAGCGDGICDDWTETTENCPQDCGYSDVMDDEDELKENYDNIMAEMKDIIPEVPEKEKLLDISSFYTPSATCYFSAGASLANYMENISYDEFIWYGRPLHFQYDTRWNTLRTGVGGGELTFESFYNLGYKPYVGRTKKMFFPTPEKLHMTASRNFIFFDTKEEALDLIKRLLSADIPVMINLQVGTTPDYLFIKGYDETHIFIPPYVDSNGEYLLSDDMPLFNEEATEDKETQSLTYEKFFSLWEETGDTFYWFVKNNERKTEQEIFQVNRKDAEEAYDNVQKFIENPDFGFHTSGDDQMTATATASRYLTKQGHIELGEKYMELATLYGEKRSQWETVNMYPQTAELYKEAEELW